MAWSDAIERFRDIVEAIPPDSPYSEPGFRRAPAGVDLRRADITGDPVNDTRRFQLTGEGTPEWGPVLGNPLHLSLPLQIHVQYVIPEQNGGFDRFVEMSGNDKWRILGDLESPTLSAGHYDGVGTMNLQSVVDTYRGQDCWLISLDFRVQFDVYYSS